MVKIKFGGGKWPLASAPTVELAADEPFESSLNTILEALSVDDAEFRTYAMHTIQGKELGPEISLKTSPNDNKLADGRTIFMKKRSASPAGGAKAPPPPPKKGTASPVKAAPPPPPPKKGTASPAKGAPPPPPPKKSAGSPTKAAPPPPPPKKGTASPGKAAAPPPPPKKAPMKTPTTPTTPSSGTASPVKGAPPPPPKKGTASPAKGAPPPPPKKAQAPKSNASPPPPPPKKSAVAKAAAPPPPPPKKAPVKAAIDPMMMGGDSDDDDDSYVDSSDDGQPPAANAGGAKTFGFAGNPGGAATFDDSDDDDAADDSDDDGVGSDVATAASVPSSSQPSSTAAQAPPRPVQPTPVSTKAAVPPPAQAQPQPKPAPAQPQRQQLPPQQQQPQPQVVAQMAAQQQQQQQQLHQQQQQQQQLQGQQQYPQQQQPQSPLQGQQQQQQLQQQQQAQLMQQQRTAQYQQHQRQQQLLQQQQQQLQQLQQQKQSPAPQRPRAPSISVDPERLASLDADVRKSVESEISTMRTELQHNWEVQRQDTLRQQNDLEAQRAAMLSTMIEREEALHSSQAELMSRFQKRAAGLNDGDEALAELRATNEELRTQLKRRTEQRGAGVGGSVDLNAVLKLQEQLVGAVSTMTGNSPVPVSAAVGAADSEKSPTAAAAAGSSSPGPFSAAVRTTPIGGVSLTGTDVRTEQLRRLLLSIGLEKYLPVLSAKDIDATTLLAMSEEELETIGVTTLGARKRIRLEAEKRQRGPGGHSFHLGADPDGGMDIIGAIPLASSSPRGRQQQAQLQRSQQPQFTTQQRDDHVRILEQFFDMHEPKVKERSSRIFDELVLFGGEAECSNLYGALAHKYDVTHSNYRPIVLHFLDRNAAHLLPAVDLICHVYEDREAEFAESVVLRRLGQRPQPGTWINYSQAPKIVATEKGAAEQPRNTFFFNSLVGMSQKEMPLHLVKDGKAGPAAVSEPTFSFPPPNPNPRKLLPNPALKDVQRNSTFNQLFTSASVALLMQHEPQRLPLLNDIITRRHGEEQQLYIELRDVYLGGGR